jgi:WD40 repeat protein
MTRKIIFVLCFLLAPVFATNAFPAEQPEFFVQLGHSSTVHSIAFSPDGKYVASGGMDNNVKIWNAETGREIRTLQGHTSYIYFVTFSPDGRFLVSTSHDATIRLWEVASGRELRRYSSAYTNFAVFNAEGDLFFNSFGEIVIWNIHSGTSRKLKATSGSGDILAATFIDQGKHLLVAKPSGFIVVDPQTDKAVRSFQLNTAIPAQEPSIAFSADGRYVLVGKFNSLVLCDAQTGAEIRTFEGTMGKVNAVAFAPDGRHVLSGGANYTLKLWETATGREVRSIYHYKYYQYGARSGVTCVAFSPDGKRALSGYKNGVIRLWDIFRDDIVIGGVERNSAAARANIAEGDTLVSVDGRKISSWQAFAGLVAANPDNELTLVLLRNNQELSVKMIPAAAKTKDAQGKEISVGVAGLIQGGVCIRTLEGNKQSVSTAAPSPDGRHIAAAHDNGSISLWDMQGRELRSFRPYKHETSVVFSPKEQIFLSTGDDNVTVWDMAKTAPVMSFKNDSISSVGRALAYSQDGKYAAAGGRDVVTLYDMAALREIRTMPLKTFVKAVAISPSARYLAAGGSMDVKLWDAQTGADIQTMRHGSFVYSLDFTPDGKYLLSGAQIYSDQNTLKLWEVATGREVQNFGQYKKSVYAAKFSPDGKMLLTGGDKLILWNVAGARVLKTFSGHHNTIWSVAFLPDGKSILSAGEDGTVRIWSLDTGKETAQFVSFADGEWIVVTPGGYYNASLNGDKYLNIRIGNNVYGIENYREAFFRPDLVKVALSGGSLQDFRNIVDVKQPPTVNIVDTPKNVGRDEATVTLRMKDNGGGIGDIRLYLNGTAVIMDAGRAVKIVSRDDQTILKSYTLKLVKGKNVIRAVAFNSENTMQSNDAVHEVVASFASSAKPSMHALIIGINDFKNPKLKLNYPVADADLFAQTLKNASEGLFEQVHIKKLVTREQTTNEAIIREIRSFQSLRPDDLFVFYIASHGTVDEGEYFLITSNVGSVRTEKLKTDAISQHMLKEAIANIPATKKLIIIDTCNAGALGEAIQVAMLTRGMSEDTALKILSRAVGSTILSASTSMQEALEGYQGHGLFTYVLAEGLKGKADKGKTGYIRTTELADYVDNEVPVLAEKIFKRAQYPTISISGQAFPVGKVK